MSDIYLFLHLYAAQGFEIDMLKIIQKKGLF